MARCTILNRSTVAAGFCTFTTVLASGLLLIFVCLSSASAADSAGKSPSVPLLSEEQAENLPRGTAQIDDIPLLDEESEETMDAIQQRGSEMLINAASWIDSFFYDPRYSEEENRTRARLKLKFGYSRFYDFEFKPSIDLNINLPQMNNKIVIFSEHPSVLSWPNAMKEFPPPVFFNCIV